MSYAFGHLGAHPVGYTAPGYVRSGYTGFGHLGAVHLLMEDIRTVPTPAGEGSMHEQREVHGYKYRALTADAVAIFDAFIDAGRVGALQQPTNREGPGGIKLPDGDNVVFAGPNQPQSLKEWFRRKQGEGYGIVGIDAQEFETPSLVPVTEPGAMLLVATKSVKLASEVTAYAENAVMVEPKDGWTKPADVDEKGEEKKFPIALAIGGGAVALGVLYLVTR